VFTVHTRAVVSTKAFKACGGGGIGIFEKVPGAMKACTFPANHVVLSKAALHGKLMQDGACKL